MDKKLLFVFLIACAVGGWQLAFGSKPVEFSQEQKARATAAGVCSGRCISGISRRFFELTVSGGGR